MAKALINAGSTSWVSEIFIQDSSSTTGAGKTGLRPDTASLTAYYKRNSGTAAVAISLGTITTLGTWVTGGFKEVDATNMPGLYEFDPPDLAIANGATSVAFVLKGAANMAPVALEAELVHINTQDAVRMGLTALPNAAAEAAGGLYTRGSGAGQINQLTNGMVDTNLVAWEGFVPNGLVGGGRVDVSVGQYQSGLAPLQPTISGSKLDVTAGKAGIDWSNIGTPTATVNLSGTTIAVVTSSVGFVIGDIGGNLQGSAASVTGAVGSVTGNVGGNVTGSVGSVVGAVGSVTGNVGGNVTGSIGSLAAVAKQNVMDQVQNTMGSTTWTQPGQASPPANQTLVGMSAYIYKSMRNRVTQSSTTFSLFNDDSVTLDQKATTADDGTTFSRTKLVSGP